MSQKKPNPTQREQQNIDRMVAYFRENRHKFEALAKSVLAHIETDEQLMAEMHSFKYRIKDPEHLRDKLTRKLLEAKSTKREFKVTKDNLFQQITDLAGIRILHLHTHQVKEIHTRLLGIFEEHRYKLVEKPIANCWDVEFQSLFKKFGIATRSRDSLYTTIHYVIEANQRSQLTCEIQVRTLMDEVWGEVSRAVSYPNSSQNTACEDQIKVLARLTSGCVRLVDSIFRTYRENKSS